MRRLRKFFQRQDDPREKVRQRGLRISLPAACIIGISVAALLAWAFVMGLMVGQGQHPEAGLREFAGWPAKEAAEEEVAIFDPPSPQAAEADAPPEAAPAPPGAYPFERPTAEQTQAWNDKPAPPVAPAPESKTQPKAPERKPEPQFDYTFQVAAFKTSAEGENLRGRLNKLGIRSTVRKSGKVFLVIASLRGSSNAPVELEKKLATLKLGKPLQLSRKPAGSPSTRKK